MVEGIALDDVRKIIPGYQQVAKVTNGLAILPKISITWLGYTNVTDDRVQRDGHVLQVRWRNQQC